MYLSVPLSPEFRAPILALQATIKRLDEFALKFAGIACRVEMQAEHSKEAGHRITARDGFLPCSLAYGGAQLLVFMKAHDCMEHNQALGKIVVLI
jgi:hypothetical protein